MRARHLALGPLLVGLVATAAACGDDVAPVGPLDGGPLDAGVDAQVPDAGVDGGPPPVVFLRAARVGGGESAFTVSLEGETAPFASDLPLPALTPYVERTAGTFVARFVASDGVVVASPPVDLTESERATFLLHDAEGAPAVLVIEEPSESLGDDARTRFVLAATGYTVALDVDVDDPTAPDVVLSPLALDPTAAVLSPGDLTLHFADVVAGAEHDVYTIRPPRGSETLVVWTPSSTGGVVPVLLEPPARAEVLLPNPVLYMLHTQFFTPPTSPFGTYEVFLGAPLDPTGERQDNGAVELLNELRYGDLERFWVAPTPGLVEAFVARESTRRPRNSTEGSLRGAASLPAPERGASYLFVPQTGGTSAVLDTYASGARLFGVSPDRVFGVDPLEFEVQRTDFPTPAAGQAVVRLIRQFNDGQTGSRRSPLLRADLRPEGVLRGEGAFEGTNTVTREQDESGRVPYAARELRFHGYEPPVERAAGAYVLDLRFPPAEPTATPCNDAAVVAGRTDCVATLLASFPLQLNAGEQLYVMLVGRLNAFELFVVDTSDRPWTMRRVAATPP